MKVFPSTPFVFNTGTATFEAERRRLLRMATEGELCGSPHPGRDLPSPFAFSQQFHSAPEIITLRNVTVFSAKIQVLAGYPLAPGGDYMQDWLCPDGEPLPSCEP